MRRIAFLFLGLCLTVGTIGCKEDTTDTDATPPATETPADDAADTPAEDAAETPAP